MKKNGSSSITGDGKKKKKKRWQNSRRERSDTPKIPITRLIESATSPNSTYIDVNCAIKFFGLVQKYRFPLNSNDWIQLKSRQADTISFFPFEMKSRAWNNLPAPLAALFLMRIFTQTPF